MADTRYWEADATAVAQVDTFTPANVEVDDVFTLTATGTTGTTVAIAYTAEAATVADVTAGLVALWNASSSTLCTGITAADDTTALTLTADTAGTPFSVAATAVDGGGTDDDTQTLTRAATTPSDGPNNYDNTDNWSDAAIPITGDTVIFDGRTTEDCLYGMDQTGVSLLDMLIRKTYTGTIGSASLTGGNEGPLILEATGTIAIDGSASLYLQCGNNEADADIPLMIINTTGTVELSSQKNASEGNIGEFTTVRVLQAKTLFSVAGDADTSDTGAESGTYVKNLYIMPTRNSRELVTAIIGDQCYDQQNTAKTDIWMSEGKVTCYSEFGTLIKADGLFTVGGTGYDMGATDDTIGTIIQSNGTFTWKPSAVTASVATGAAAAPVIGLADIYGGTFDASAMLRTGTTAPTITILNTYPNTKINIDNGYANFSVGTVNKYGGTIQTTPGQVLTI